MALYSVITADGMVQNIVDIPDPTAYPVEDGQWLDVYDTIYAAGQPWTTKDMTIEQLRAYFCERVDAETRRRIALGYAFTGLSRLSPTVPVTLHYSLSSPAQMNLVGYRPALVPSWPLLWDCSDDSDAIILPDAAAAEGFVLTGLGTVAYRIDYGRNIRRVIQASNTLAEILAAATPYIYGTGGVGAFPFCRCGDR
jgi:hypothetical protein